ncbi:hypothetical protein CK623_00985 [Vandammella animalimorsus]|uniref:Uncharacterized protein n=1 Tax=Vandammella animalimorsus TaxID=2029117 RepID=A0A2A2AUY1_9BURK|nr:hypothetical protein [Vandammella animalimorsus]PAT41538.1 hypothetical protein CK623_00985 [Vandammella animalimorsus]
MSDAFWGFWGSVIGSLIGGAIAYFVALKAAAAQTDATWKIEGDKRQKELAMQLLQAIDEYVLCSFRGTHEERQRAARRLLTCAALCMPDQITALQHCIKKVDEYRYAKEQDRPLPKGVNFKATQDFFNQLQTTITQKHFNFALEPAAQDGEPPNA